MATLAGKQVQVKINDEWVVCQMDATVTGTINVTEDEICKPDPTSEEGDLPYTTVTADSRSCTVTFNSKAFADELGMNNVEINDLFFNGDATMDVKVQSVQNNKYAHPLLLEWAGTVLITDLANNFPQGGAANIDVTLTSNGAFTFTKTPVTPPVTP